MKYIIFLLLISVSVHAQDTLVINKFYPPKGFVLERLDDSTYLLRRDTVKWNPYYLKKKHHGARTGSLSVNPAGKIISNATWDTSSLIITGSSSSTPFIITNGRSGSYGYAGPQFDYWEPYPWWKKALWMLGGMVVWIIGTVIFIALQPVEEIKSNE